MKLKYLFLLAIFSSLSFASLPPSFVGDYEGAYVEAPANSKQAKNPYLAGKVVPIKDSIFEIQIFMEFDLRAHYEIKQEVSMKDGSLHFKGTDHHFKVDDSGMTGTLFLREKGKTVSYNYSMNKIVRLSPTLGRKKPEGGIDLFPDNSLELWEHEKSKPATWKVLDAGVVECFSKKKGNKNGGSIRTKKHFKSCELHLEFKMPYLPGNTGQNRGNSGLFIHSKYEVQILDSYGLEGDWRQCGALYKLSPPKVNMCAPPEQWQTYDIVYQAAQFDESGVPLSKPKMTVKHNGFLIHNQQVLFDENATKKTMSARSPSNEPGFIQLQDHGHAVQYRNFWIREL